MRKFCLKTASMMWAWVALAQQPAPVRLDTTTFVVMGEGLAAGMADYGLRQEVQDKSFPAQIARQMRTAFPQPLIQGPGIGKVIGLQELPARLPTYPQTTVRVFPVNPAKAAGEVDAPTLFVLNLSLPNWKLADSVTRKPAAPLIQANSAQQTTINLILGFPALILERNVPLWTQFEYAQAMNPTLVLIELGYYEALEAAAAGDPGLIPAAAAFRATYTDIVKGLRALNAQVVVTTIPDPIDTAYFTPAATAAQVLKTQSLVIFAGYNLKEDDFVTRTGLSTIGNQLLHRQIGALPAGSILRGSVATEIRTRVRALNAEIANVARDNGAVLYDLQAFFSRVRTAGTTAGSRRLTADYLGGFYSLDGVYPSITGHALIANDILGFLNRTYSQNFPLLNLAQLPDDPALGQKPASAPGGVTQ